MLVALCVIQSGYVGQRDLQHMRVVTMQHFKLLVGTLTNGTTVPPTIANLSAATGAAVLRKDRVLRNDLAWLHTVVLFDLYLRCAILIWGAGERHWRAADVSN